MTSTDIKVLEMSIEANIHIRALTCLVVTTLLLEGFVAMKKRKMAVQSILHLKSVELVL